MCPGEKRTPIMGQNVRTNVIVSLGVVAVSLLLLLYFSRLPVAHSQAKPGPPSAPPVTVSVIEVSPKAMPIYTEYRGCAGRSARWTPDQRTHDRPGLGRWGVAIEAHILCCHRYASASVDPT